ncbi:MAG: hypothetical protein LBS35_12995 [Synergistaceae bacterium]|nr:hypothetical protein [Synergistaceae bacterium]
MTKDEGTAVIMTFRELLNRFSLDELWYYLSMRHGLQSKPIKARKSRELYGAARDELLALELNQGETIGELSCDFCADKIDECDDTFFHVSLKEAEETYAIDFISWTDIIDLPVSQTSLDRYGEWLCAAEILWEVTFHGYSADAVASESDLLNEAIEEVKSGKAECKPFDPDKFKREINPFDVEATLGWFASAPDCVKRSIRDCIAADVVRDEDNEQVAVAKTLEKLEKIAGDELKTEDIVDLPLRMTLGLDIDDTLLLLEALDGKRSL